MSIAIWSGTSDVYTYDERYNVPLHNLVNHLDGSALSWPLSPGFEPILLHYHYLAEAQYQAQLRRVLARTGCSSDVQKWIEDRLSLFNPKVRYQSPLRRVLSRIGGRFSFFGRG